ncbi:putative reverse transcriptase domain-containing protein [Tanacetum coccineum]
MTSSSTNELFTPYKEPEREFRSSRRHFKTLSLDELRSPDFNLLSDQEYSEDEEAEAMAETMEQYMNKTRTDYGSGFARPKINNKDQFELKGQFLKELRENTFSGSNIEDANEHIEKVLEIVDLFHVPNITEVILFYNGLDVPTRHILESRGVVLTKTAADAKMAIQEMAEYSQKWYNGTSRGRSTETSNGLPAIQAQLNSLGREIKKKKLTTRNLVDLFKEGDIEQQLLDAAIKNQGALIKTLEIQIGQMSKVLQERGFRSLPSSTETNSRDQVKSISTTIEAESYSIRRASVSVMPLLTYLNLGLGELAHTKLTVKLADKTMKYPKGIAENVLVGIGKFTFPIDFIILDMPEDIKVPLILERQFLSTARAKIDVYKRKILIRVGEEKIIYQVFKPASSINKRVYMISLRERIELDLEARLMGETLVLNRSLDPFLEDYIELNDLNEPFELRRNQGDDLMPTIKKGEVIDEFRTMNEDLDTGINDYPSYCDDDKKIHKDYAHNLKFSCMIGFKFTHANFFPLLYVNVMSKKFHNLIMKDKMVYKGNNVVGALMNVPIFVGTFSIMTDFAVLEDMDAYRDEGMGDVIFGEPFLKEVGIKTKQFEGRITIYNDDDNVTYQMVRSHPRFKNHTNKQCNKIPPLLKVSEVDKKNGILHAYQKLKGFYKGVLNLGPNYIQDGKMEEWLTRGHISVHEMK